MYDTIHAYLHQSMVDSVDLISEIPLVMENKTYSENKNGLYCSGNINNLRLSVSERGLSIKGSLSKYYFGSNTFTLSRSDSKKAIDQLSVLLNVSLGNAKISRVDFGTNLILAKPVSTYFQYLGDCRFFERFMKADSLYYQNGSRTIMFYDKIKELKNSRSPLPEDWKNQNVVRYEIRFSHRVAKQLKEQELTISTLYREDFFKKMKERYLKDYYSIYKVSTSIPDCNMIEKPNDLFDQYALNWINEKGVNIIFAEIECLNKSGAFSRKEYASRAKRKVKELQEKFTLVNSSALIEELSSKVLIGSSIL